VYASPAVAGDTLFVGSCSGYCYALNKNTGDLIWKKYLGGLSFHGNPLVVDSMLLIPSDGSSGALNALALSNGTKLWQQQFPGNDNVRGGMRTDLTCFHETVMGVSTLDVLIGLDVTSGTRLWEFASIRRPDRDYRNVAPVLHDSVVFFAGFDGWLYCIDPVDGGVSWKSNIGARPTTSLALHEDHLYIGAADSTLCKLSARNGTVIVRLELEARPRMRLSLAGSMLILLCESFCELYGTRRLMGVDLEHMEIAWDLPVSVDSRWTVKKAPRYERWIVAGNAQGEILMLQPETGHIEKTFKVAGRVRSITFDNEVMHVGTIEGHIQAVRIIR